VVQLHFIARVSYPRLFRIKYDYKANSCELNYQKTVATFDLNSNVRAAVGHIRKWLPIAEQLEWSCAVAHLWRNPNSEFLA
jgi:hypothetical protein